MMPGLILQVLQEIDTGGAMHLGQGKSDIHLLIASILRKLVNDGLVIKVGKPFTNETPFCLNAWVAVKIIVTAEVILLQ